MGRIPEHVIDEVRSRADIVAVVGRHVTLKPTGPRHWGLCPFHSEKTPSFQVHAEKQIFYCFGCNVGGDVFSFRMRHDALDFPDAVRATAREVGIEIAEAHDAKAGRAPRLHAIHETALGFYRDALRSSGGVAARRYLEARGIPDDLIDRFQIGFAPERWDALVGFIERGANRREAVAAALEVGLLSGRQDGNGNYDRFRNRLLFPLLEPGGKIVGFGGRALDDSTPKYLNSPESPVYRKGRLLFGLPQAIEAIRATGRAVVVEGYFDVLALHRSGVAEAVAPCGTALTAEHARRLRRYTSEVVLLFDADEAGRRAAQRALPTLLGEGLRVRAAFLPEGEDPDSLIERAGTQALVATLEAAAPLLDHLIEEQLKGASEHAWAAADAAQAIAPFLRAVPDQVERAYYVRQVSARLQVPVESLEQSLAERSPRPREAPQESRAQPLKLDAVTRTLLEALVAHPDLVPLIDARAVSWLPAGPARVLVERLAEATRLRGDAAVPALCSAVPGDRSEDDAALDLDPPSRAALVQLAAALEPVERRDAEQAVRDCVARLERQALRSEYRELRTRLESTTDPIEAEALLAAMQEKLELPRRLEGSEG